MWALNLQPLAPPSFPCPPLSPSWAPPQSLSCTTFPSSPRPKPHALPLKPCPHPVPPALQEYHLGIGITFIDMSVGNVKEVDRRSFDLTTPYRIFR